jgi:membrane associated rhomboid family serine protease
MIRTIKEDLNQVFSSGSMVSVLIVINVILYVFFLLCYIIFANISPDIYQKILGLFRIPGDFLKLLIKPWSLITYMFTHEGFWHLLWNMMGLNIFGRIVGDLLGDRRILPVYILGGLGAALGFLLWANFPGGGVNAYALGASGSVMALAGVAAVIAPDYQIRLLLLGNIKLLYIVIAFVLFDLVGISAQNNTGGHIGHLAGLATGLLVIYGIKNGVDTTEGFNNFVNKVTRVFSVKNKQPVRRPKMKVEYGTRKLGIDMFKPVSTGKTEKMSSGQELSDEEELNRILERIKNVGYENITLKEKVFLKKMSERE